MSRAACAAQVETARLAYRHCFGHEAAHGAIAPGRVNLIGEHTDYNDGFVMPMAIDRHTVVLARRTTASHSMFIARDLDERHVVDLRQPLKPIGESFADYVLAVFEQFKARGVDVPNLELLITGDIPRGAGLSSSASVEVALAVLLRQITGADCSPIEVAEICQAAERDFVGVPCGIMDMFIISLAQADHAMFLDCRTLDYQALAFPTHGDVALLVVDTGVERSLRSGEYALRRRQCASAASKLNVPALRDVSAEMITASTKLDDDERRRVLHVVAENQRVLQAADAMRAGRWNRLGELMFDSHASLRDNYEVSIRELDAVVEAAQRLRDQGQGVFGARMIGAGFGGCAIVLCRNHAVTAVSRAIGNAFESEFDRHPKVMRVHAVNGAESLSLT